MRHRETGSHFYVLLWLVAHTYHMLKTTKPLGLVPNGFGEL